MQERQYRVMAVTDDSGQVLHPDWLQKAQATHRQLRPGLPEAYAQVMQQVFEHGGRMTLAVRGDAVIAVMVWRVIVNTAYGRALYVDDLVTDAALRSTGAGKALLDWGTDKAVQLRCDWLTLDSGTQRTDAHRFYFRERMHVSSFHFVRRVGAMT